MKLNLERSPLVLLGAWNQAIFSPDWVKRKVFPETPNLTVELLGFPPTSLRSIADEMLLGLEGPRLRLAPRHPSSASFAGVERTGRLVLERLPETPVEAIGINVAFDVESPPERLRKVMSFSDEPDLAEAAATLEAASLSRSFLIDGQRLNLTVVRPRSGAAWQLDFNYHTDVQSAEEARESARRADQRSVPRGARSRRETLRPACGGTLSQRSTTSRPTGLSMTGGVSPVGARYRFSYDRQREVFVLPADPAALEAAYRRLGARKGPHANPSAWHDAKCFWRETGTDGAEWLVRRLRTERRVEVLDDAANVLAEIGEPGIAPVLDGLEDSKARPQEEALLTALRWLRLPPASSLVGRAESLLARLSESDDVDLAVLACLATRALGRERAIPFLERVEQETAEDEVREAARAELDEYRAA